MPATAASRRPPVPDRFDGTWSVEIITEAGTCDRAYRYPVRIENGRARFKQEFERNLREVLLLYRHADVESTRAGLVLRPSRTSVPMRGLRVLSGEAYDVVLLLGPAET